MTQEEGREREMAELIFIPSPVMGHIAQTLDLAKLMVDRDARLHITILLIKLPIDPVGCKFIDSLTSDAIAGSEHCNIRFLHLPTIDPSPDWDFNTPGVLLSLLIEHHKPHVRRAVAQMADRSGSSTASSPVPIGGFVVDMFCTPMIDVADEFGVPTYVFFTSNAAFLGLMLHLQNLHDGQGKDIAEFENSDAELIVPSFENPVPPTVLPFVLMNRRSWSTRFLPYARGYRKARGIIINTFVDVESHALRALSPSASSLPAESEVIPPIYPVGPLLNRNQTHNGEGKSDAVMTWLDDQPPSSVVFLCFGSRGVFHGDQVKEIACGLEQSGYRFLWSLRRPPRGEVEFPGDYAGSGEEVLPAGFLDRTQGRGRVVAGWVPQLAVLSHPAVGGFVSHCGWNSLLESLWCGVPVATWPVYAEQQLNAFQMTRELGLAVEITLDYHNREVAGNSGHTMVTAKEIEKGIREVMEADGLVRARVKELGEKSRRAVKEGGSSHASLENLIIDIFSLI